MPVPGSIKITDYANEVSFFQPNLPSTGTPAANLAALEAIITPAFNNGLILGLPSNEKVSYFAKSALSGAILNTAQRESKWLVVYEDISPFLDPPTNSVANPYYGKRFVQELPTANAGVLSNNSDSLPLSDPAATGFVTAMAANAVSPVGGAIAIVEIRFVGRNL